MSYNNERKPFTVTISDDGFLDFIDDVNTNPSTTTPNITTSNKKKRKLASRKRITTIKNLVFATLHTIFFLAVSSFIVSIPPIESFIENTLLYQLQSHFVAAPFTTVNVDLLYRIIMSLLAVIVVIWRMRKRIRYKETKIIKRNGYEESSNGERFVNDGTYLLLTTNKEGDETTRMYSSPTGTIHVTTQKIVNKKSVIRKTSCSAMLFSVTVPIAVFFSPLLPLSFLLIEELRYIL